jgi:hypothetical protein
MRTAHAEWWHDGTGWKRYGTDRDPIVFVPRDARPGSAAWCGYVYADTPAEAARVDAEVFGASAA